MALKKSDYLSFDVQVRTKKKEWILASALAIKNSSTKEESAKKIREFLELIEDGSAGSYTGTDKQFKSFYTMLLEFGIIEDTTGSVYKLSALAEKVADGDLSPKYYLTKVFLNYVEEVKGEIINVLKEILSYMLEHNLKEINKNQIQEIEKFKLKEIKEPRGPINQLFAYLKNTEYFNFDGKDALIWESKCSIENIKNQCCFPEDGIDLGNQIEYAKYLTTEHIPQVDFEISKNLNRNLPYQKIVYGAPGTGKSYGLANEVKVKFPNFINSISEFNTSENNEKIWLVGANWEGFNKYPEFIENNKWINGYDSGSDFQRAEKMSIGDYIIIKTAYFTGEGNKIPTLEIKAIGKIKSIKVVGKEVEVEWLIKDLSKKIIGENFRATVHDISQKKDLVNKIFDNTEIFTKKTEEIKASQRVTFYDGYTYGQFVGAYKPVMYEKDNEEKEIGYEFVAGPLLKQVLNAYKYPEKDFVLVIEEINRAKADRIFGDVFQLLDRNSEGDSEYPILLSQEQENYFKENLDGERYLETIAKKEGLYLPNNLYIWATMNSADQGVYPMDTAFKRRWDFEYIPLNKNKREEEFFIEIYKEKYSWNDYRETLNDILGEQGVTEDRLISPYFLKETDFDENKILKKSSYINKFLMYVFDDILKHNNRLKEALFTEKNFYKIFEKIENEQIYSINFLDRLNERTKKVDDEITEE